MKRTLRLLFIIIATLCASSCHFVFKGTGDSLSQAYSPLSLTATSVPPKLKSILKRRLLDDGIHIAHDLINSRYNLTLHQEEIQRHILSVSSGSSSRQYQLLYQLYFSFEKIKGPILIQNTSVLVTRFLTINNDRILGSHDEEENIIDDMRRDAALQVVQRINALPLSLKNKKGHS